MAPTRRVSPASPPSASASQALRQKLAAMDAPEARRLRSPRRLSRHEKCLAAGRRRLGLRHRLRRPRSRARERAQRQRARPRHRSLFQHRRPAIQGDAARRGRKIRLGGKGDGKERSWDCWPTATVTSTSPAWPWGRKCRKRCRPFSKPKPIPGLRSSSPTAIASPTATTWRTACRSRSWRWIPASGRSTVSIRAAWPRASRRSISTMVRRKRGSPTTCATSRASAWSSAPIPRASRVFSRRRRRPRRSATRSTSSSRASPCPRLMDPRTKTPTSSKPAK